MIITTLQQKGEPRSCSCGWGRAGWTLLTRTPDRDKHDADGHDNGDGGDGDGIGGNKKCSTKQDNAIPYDTTKYHTIILCNMTKHIIFPFYRDVSCKMILLTKNRESRMASQMRRPVKVGFIFSLLQQKFFMHFLSVSLRGSFYLIFQCSFTKGFLCVK